MGQGSIRLFRLFGIDVSLHWSWLLVAILEINARVGKYSSPAWNVAEYLTLFGIVLLHEFGHALACKQVGGRADHITLWPLGGIAYVSPPPRPGAVLWSIAAGPLVNVVLLPVLFGLAIFAHAGGLAQTSPDAARFLETVANLNLVLLVFNLLPIYPLDGGQIVQALLWFLIGRAASLMVASILGLVCVVGGAAAMLALGGTDIWLLVILAFMGLRCVSGFQQAQALSRMARMPRHEGLACPSCGQPPLRGPLWQCHHCGSRFDTFASGAACPQCGMQFDSTSCPECGGRFAIGAWLPPAQSAGEPAAGVGS